MEKRDTNFDFYKSMLIIGVVLGHCVTALKAGSGGTVFLHTFVRTYDMPMFAFISGIFLRKSMNNHCFPVNLLNKTCTIFFSVVLWNLIFNLISGKFILKISTFWFLWALFICQAIILGIRFVFGKIKPLYIIALLAACAFLHCGVISFFDSYHVGFLFFPMLVGLGYDELKKWGQKVFKNKKIVYFLCINILFILLLCFWNSDYSVWTTDCNIFASKTPLQTMGKIVYRAAIGIVGTLAMMENFDRLSVFVRKIVQEITPVGGDKAYGFLTRIGQTTMEIYILQSLFVEKWGAALIRKMIAYFDCNPFMTDIEFLGWFEAPLIAIFSVVFCYFVQYGIKKIPFIGIFFFGYPVGKLLETKTANRTKRNKKRENPVK